LTEIIKGLDLDTFDNNSTFLLINPPVYDVQYWAAWSLPTGLLRLSAALRRRGHRVILLDAMKTNQRRRVSKTRLHKVEIGDVHMYMYHWGLPAEKIHDRLGSIRLLDQPDYVFVTSALTYWWESTRDTVGWARDALPKAPVYVGGIYPTLNPHHCAENVQPDFVVVGNVTEAEDEWLDFAAYADNDHPSYSIITSKRGCPFNCAYCAQKHLNPEFHRRDVDDVVSEVIHKYRHYNMREFAFYEDNLLIDSQHFRRILEGFLHAELRGLRLYAPEGLEPRLLTPELATLMKRVGWRKIHLGFESFSEKQLEKWNRRHATLQHFDAAVEACTDAGFRLRSPEINAFILYGMPEETIDDVMDSLLFVAHRVGSTIPMLFTPVPKSDLYTKYEDYFELQGFDLHDLNGKLYPFWELNGIRPSDYVNLQRLMFALNAQMRGTSFDVGGQNQVAVSFRRRLGRLFDSGDLLREIAATRE